MNVMPWKESLLDQWSISSMYHYYAGDKKFLYVSMVRDDKCITVDGEDDKYLWNRLWHKADHINKMNKAL